MMTRNAMLTYMLHYTPNANICQLAKKDFSFSNVIWIHPLGIMNVCTYHSHGDQSHSS